MFLKESLFGQFADDVITKDLFGRFCEVGLILEDQAGGGIKCLEAINEITFTNMLRTLGLEAPEDPQHAFARVFPTV